MTADGVALVAGDEVAVFNANGDCAGKRVITGSNDSVPVWGDFANGDRVFNNGEQMHFRVWDQSSGLVYDDISTVNVTFIACDSSPICEDQNAYAANKLYKVDDLAATGGHLPVELTSFDALVSGQDVLLNWETASETVNAGFEVQMRDASAELAVSWATLDFVEGHGTTLEAQAYQFRVPTVEPGTYRFRLKQVDFDGTFEYHPEVEVTVEAPEEFVISSAYPNPFNPQTTFTVALQSAQDVTVSVYNTLGQRVALLHQGALSAHQTHQFTFEAQGLASGLYLLSIQGERFQRTQRVMLMK